MHKSMAGLALGAVLSLPAAPTAFAAQSIDTAAFTITYQEGIFSTIGSITLLDESPGAYSFALDTLNEDMAGVTAQDVSGLGELASAAHASILRIDANAGYRVTGFSLTFTTFGELSPGQLPGFPPGFVSNEAGVFMGIWTPTSYQPLGSQYGPLTAQETWEFGASDLTLPEVTDLAFNTWLRAQAVGVDGGGEFAPSLASASIRDAVLHVEVAAIPEPGTWAMLITGLGLLAARRYKSMHFSS
ncbi:PEP-CTERM sorting domain-containing protein [Massilia sp. METH4]|uniref:PEP-CTERM sorting domain-containing protein n=1 Tax=Massilia sp. METH4 TaxID=3123041 RepID=UPI0030CFE5BC